MIIPLTKGKVAFIDEEDSELVNGYKWYTSYYGYAIANFKGNKILMHRLIMQTPTGMETDHINRDKLDNRKLNLRVCRHSENMRNTKLRADNTSGRRGVRWLKNNKRWNARIHIDGKEISLGCYSNREDASKAYNSAAKQYHLDYANLNKIYIT